MVRSTDIEAGKTPVSESARTAPPPAASPSADASALRILQEAFRGGLSRRGDLKEPIDPFLVAINSIPRIALAPLFVIWFGIDLASKVVLAATLVYFLTFFNTLSGIRSADPRLVNIARTMGATQWQIFRKVVLPGAASWIMTGLRTSLPFALIGVIVGEFVAASAGLGFRLNFYATSYNAAGTMAMLVVMMAIMMALNFAMVLIENYLMRWQPKSVHAAAST